MIANQAANIDLSEYDIVPQYAARIAESLGASISVHEPSRANKGAGFLLSILFFIGGFALVCVAVGQLANARGQLPIWAQRGDSWISEMFVILFGCFLIGCGLFLWRLSQKLFSLRIVIGERGFCVFENSTTDIFTWDDISAINETILHERLPIGPAALLMPTKTSRTYTVRRRDGKEFRFHPTNMPNLDALATPLAKAAKERNISWQTTEQTA